MPIHFRPESTQYQQTRWNGKVLLLKGWPTWLTVLLSGLFLAALIAFLLLANYSRRVNVTGEIITEPHTINLFAPEQGVISQLRVHNGQTVSPGMPLYQLDVSQVTLTGNVTATSVAAIEKQQHQLDAIIRQLQNNKQQTLANLQQQLKQYQQAQQSVLAMVALAQEGLNDMQRSRNNYENALRKGLINTDQMNNQRYLYFQQQSVYQGLNSQAIQQAVQITNLQSDQLIKAAEFDNQISQARFQSDDLSRQLAQTEAQGDRIITAPSHGIVSSLSVTPGQMVNAGDSLIQLVPSSHPRFLLITWLPDDSRPWIKAGDTINIRFAAFPYEKYGQFPGRILSVSAAPIPARELESWVSAPRGANGTVSGSWYKATVALDHLSLTLSSGMMAQSTLFLEKRPLYQWMFSPYYSLKKSLTGPVDEQ